jgi:hypothetical protein
LSRKWVPACFRRFPVRAIAPPIPRCEATIARSIRFAQAASDGDPSPRGSSFSTAKTNRVKGVAAGTSARSPAVVTSMPIPPAIPARSRTKLEYQARGAGPFRGFCCPETAAGIRDKACSSSFAAIRASINRGGKKRDISSATQLNSVACRAVFTCRADPRARRTASLAARRRRKARRAALVVRYVASSCSRN